MRTVNTRRGHRSIDGRAGRWQRLVLTVICAAALAGMGTGSTAHPSGIERAPVLVQTLAGAGALVGFLPGGKTILTVSRDGDYTVRDWRSGKALQEYSPGGQVDDQILRGARLYLLYRDGDLTVSDAATGRELRSIHVGAGYGKRLLWVSPDGEQAAVSASGKPLTIYDLRSGSPVRCMKDPRIIELSPDGKLAVVRGAARIVLIDTAGRTVGAVPTVGAASRAVAFSANGKQFVVWFYYPVKPGDTGGEYASALVLVNTRTGKTVKRLTGGGNPAWLDALQLVFSPDGRWLAGGGVPDTMVLWALPRGRRIAVIRGRELGSYYPLSGIAFSADGRYLAVGLWEGDISIYELPTSTSTTRRSRSLRDAHGRPQR